MSNYFTTNWKRRKTHWQVPVWIDKKRTEYEYNFKSRVWKSIVKAGDDIRTTEYKYDMFGNII
jgi:hypothetical protein